MTRLSVDFPEEDDSKEAPRRTRRSGSRLLTWRAFLPGRILGRRRGDEEEGHVPGGVLPLSAQVLPNPEEHRCWLKSHPDPDSSNLEFEHTEENSQLIEIVLCEDPVVIGLQAQLLFGSAQAQENAQASFSVLH